MSVYDRIELIVAGKQKLSARPINFRYDDDGNPVEVTLYETTCPGCGNMIQFVPSQMVEKDGLWYVGCFVCNKGFVEPEKSAPELVVEPEVIVRPSGQKLEKERPLVPVDRGCPFIDPIEVGIFEAE